MDSVLQKPVTLTPGIVVKTPSTQHLITIEARESKTPHEHHLAAINYDQNDQKDQKDDKGSSGKNHPSSVQKILKDEPKFGENASFYQICDTILGSLKGKIEIIYEVIN